MTDDRSSFNHRDLPATIESYRRAPASRESSGEEMFSLHGYRQILRRRRATVFSAAAIITILAALYSFKTKPVYRATAKIEVDAEASPLEQADNQPGQSPGVSDAYLQTQVDILQSDDLAWQTIAQFGLDRNGKFGSAGKTGGGSTLSEARVRRSRILASFEKHLQVRLAPGSHIILVSYEDTDPALAQQIPNALVAHYLQYHFMTKYASTRQVSDWMARELSDLKKQVVASQQALVDYEKKNDVADMANSGSLAQNALDDLSRQLTAAQTDRAAKKALYDALKTTPSAAGLLTKDSLLSGLQGKYGDLETEYAKSLAQYGPKFYKVVQIRKQIDEVDLLIRQQQKREQEQMAADYRAAGQRVAILSRAVSEKQAEVEKLNQLQIPYDILKNEYQTNQSLYQSLLGRLKNAEITAGLKATDAHLLDRASYPVAPVRPEKDLDVAIGMISGLLVGLTLAFVREALDTSVKRPEDLENVIGAPVLALIPDAESLPGGRARLARREPRSRAMIEQSVLKRPGSPMAEAYRTLRTSILRLPGSRAPQVLLFTSTQPREGKTSTCANLALSLASLNRRVLLIDADLRRGQMRELFQLSATRGLSDVLAGGAPLASAIRQIPEAPNLWVLPAGRGRCSPADLLSSPIMEEMLKDLRRRFEFILIDSPPLLLVADPTILARCVDGIILVASSARTARDAVWRALRILETAGEKLLGAVVNRVDVRRENDYDYYRIHHQYFSQEEPAQDPAPASSNGNHDRPAQSSS
jgi:polysaccharide biosynthesis transport protein